MKNKKSKSLMKRSWDLVLHFTCMKFILDRVYLNRKTKSKSFLFSLNNLSRSSDLHLLTELLGGYICSEAIELTHNLFYKSYFKRKKRVQNEEKEKLKLSVSSILALGLLGAYFISKWYLWKVKPQKGFGILICRLLFSSWRKNMKLILSEDK